MAAAALTAVWRAASRTSWRAVSRSCQVQIALPSDWLRRTPTTITPMMRPRSVAGSRRSRQPAPARRPAASVMAGDHLDREHVAAVANGLDQHRLLAVV